MLGIAMDITNFLISSLPKSFFIQDKILKMFFIFSTHLYQKKKIYNFPDLCIYLLIKICKNILGKHNKLFLA